jgi:hypothetical protein
LESIAELGKQGCEFLITSMDIPDDVEGTMLVLQVVPERLPGNLDRGNFLRRGQHEDVTEALSL